MPILLVLTVLLAIGSPTEPVDCDAAPKQSCILKTHRVSGTITVDGRLDEADWSDAPAATGFRQLTPNEGAAASQQTEVRVLYGENNLYVGALLHDTHPDRIQARLGRRDDRNQADWFSVSIDSYFDRKSAYTFEVNAAGVQRDGIQRGGGRMSTSWDAIWYSEVRITDKGWMAEMRIPYSMLRFTGESEQWGIQFQRRIPRHGELNEWRLIPRTQRESGVVAQYGILRGLRDLAPKRNIQVTPYTVSRLQTSEGDPGQLATSTSLDAGSDLRVGLSPNVTLDATINPDFGQVESDPARLNLTAFETFFEEKRPFFVEGTEVFNFDLGRGSNMVYTRRIGADAPVVGAAKLTGRTQRGLSFGALTATTGEAFTPQRIFSVASLQQEMGTYSSMSGVLTAYDAPFDAGRRRSFSGGSKWDLRLANNTYQIVGQASATHRGGTAAALDSETGFSLATEVGKVKGAWTYEVGTLILDNQFNPNDVGRLRRNNLIRVNGVLGHEFNSGKPFGPFQRASGFLFLGQSWSYTERIDQGLGHFMRTEWTTRSFQTIELGTNSDHLFGGYDLFETRGLGPRARPRRLDVQLEFETDSRRSWRVSPEVATTIREDGGQGYEASLRGRWNVGTRVSLSGSIAYERENDYVEWASNETFVRTAPDQWSIGTTSRPPDAVDALRPLDGAASALANIFASVTPHTGTDQYYVPVYGARDTNNLDFTLRANVTFTPTLSLEYFGQLFAARGHYDRFQILQNPDHLVAFEAYPKRHDFSQSSFISNAVLRWEFQRGSEVFLVWSQSRRQRLDDPFFFDADRSSPYETSNVNQLSDTFTTFPQNAFLLKVRYTFLN